MPAFDPVAYTALLEELTELSKRAAQAIAERAGKGGVRRKDDGSPVTAADEAAEAVICEGLARLAPGVPVISEEAASREHPQLPLAPRNGEPARYFLVDPLDGTREFIAGRDDYTVNIALMHDGVPMLGLITAPARGVTWRGIVGRGAERTEHSGAKIAPPQPIRARPRPARNLVVLMSRSHLDARTRAYLDDFPEAKLTACGSSIKFCSLAEGLADLYPRLAPTHDWDIAAGHAILVAAGGAVRAADGTPLRYGTADLLIPDFIATGVPLTG